jgi:hypothetical protein
VDGCSCGSHGLASAEFPGQKVDFRFEYMTEGDDAEQFALFVDDRQVAVMRVNHDLESFGGSCFRRAHDDILAHQFANRSGIGGAAAQGELLHNVAFAEHTRDNILRVDNRHRADVAFDHQLYGFGNGGIHAHEGRCFIAQLKKTHDSINSNVPNFRDAIRLHRRAAAIVDLGKRLLREPLAGTFVDGSVFHDELHLLEKIDLRQRVAVDGDHVGRGAGSNGADLPLSVQ